MLVKWLLFLVAVVAHSWLWGHWSLESSIKITLALSFATVLLLIQIGMPIRSLINKNNVMVPFKTYWMRSIFYAYILVIIVLSLFSFTGLIQLLLPVKILLLLTYIGLRFYFKKKKNQ